MTAVDYGRPRAAADRLLKRYGQAAILLKPSTASGDAWNDTPGTPADYPVTVAVFAYTAQDRIGTGIQERDKRVLMSTEGLTVEPEDGSDTILIGGVSHSIVSVNQVAPGGVAVVYDLQVRT